MEVHEDRDINVVSFEEYSATSCTSSLTDLLYWWESFPWHAVLYCRLPLNLLIFKKKVGNILGTWPNYLCRVPQNRSPDDDLRTVNLLNRHVEPVEQIEIILTSNSKETTLLCNDFLMHTSSAITLLNILRNTIHHYSYAWYSYLITMLRITYRILQQFCSLPIPTPDILHTHKMSPTMAPGECIVTQC